MDFQNLTPEKVFAGFGVGFDCSQQVLAHCAPYVGLSEENALKLASAFGGGMWNGETCGCVTGALMALGMRYGHCTEGDADSKNALLEKKAAFEAAFREENGDLLCKKLLGHDLSTPEGMQKIMENQLLATVCPKLVCSACRIVKELL